MNGIKRDERAQTSVEFALLVGVILLIVIGVFPNLLREQELNKGLVAAREGAEFGASMRGMGFYSSGTSQANINPAEPIKIKGIEYSITENPSGVDEVTISIHVRGPAELNTDSVRGTIRTQAKRYIARTLTGAWPAMPVSNSSLTGSFYKFSPRCQSSMWTNT